MGLENPIHLMIVLMVVLLVFGAKRLPDMGRSMGEGMRGFKEAISGHQTPTDHLAAVIAQPAVPEAGAAMQSADASEVLTGSHTA